MKRMVRTVQELSAEEKLRLICGKDFWHTDDLGGKIPQITVADGPSGLRIVKERAEDGSETAYPAAAYPAISLLANTWNRAAAAEMGECLADECLEKGVDILLAPGVNIKRHPLNGRNFEYFSEDPVLAGEMAKAYIGGLQGGGVGACLKHFCCNNLEYDRQNQSSEVDERTLRELYYLPFEIACEAQPVSLMCSYNRINGTFGAEYAKGFALLRGEFGFRGAIVSDWSAVRDRTASAAAGLDLEMPFNGENYRKLCEDYRRGALSDAALDACAQRVLDLVYRCKEMRQGKKPARTDKERRAAARRIAAEGMVLLKNNGVLPLQAGGSAALSGCYARPDSCGMLRGGGSSAVNRGEEKFDLTARLAERGTEVRFEGAFRYDEVESFGQSARRAALLAAECDCSIVCVGLGEKFEREGADRETARLPAVQERAILESAKSNPNTVVVVFAGSYIDMSAWEEKAAAILFAGYPGTGGDDALADILVGKVNPSGKLSETFPRCLADVPAADGRCVSAGVTRYMEGLGVGYRCFSTNDVPVLFPFGHGLSYSAFVYSDLSASAESGVLHISFAVENASERGGAETVQVYVRECVPLVSRPDRELKDFAKAEIAAGKRKRFSFSLGQRAFAHWSASKDCWEVSDGVYEVLIGSSAQDIRLRCKLCIKNGEILLR